MKLTVQQARDQLREAEGEAQARGDLWIVEKRDLAGQLVFTSPQPWEFFGNAATQGMENDYMARAIFRKVPNAVLDGTKIATWPALLDPQFIARRKTW